MHPSIQTKVHYAPTVGEMVNERLWVEKNYFENAIYYSLIIVTIKKFK